jgi:hypothetical protein
MTTEPDDAARLRQEEEEAARLRQEVEQLRQQLDETTPSPGHRQGWWRPVVAGVLVAIAALLAPISVVASWARDEIEDTDQYVETVTPLASDPAVQNAIATRIEDEIFSRVDIDALTQEAVDAISQQDLPARVTVTLKAFSGPLAGAIKSFISDQIQAFVESDRFEQLWINANRDAHQAMVAVLTGEGSQNVDVSNGAVSINIGQLVSEVKQDLVNRGFAIADRIPDVTATYTLFQSDDLTKAQDAFRLLDGVATWLPLVGLVLLAAAVMVARDRRRALLAVGLAIAGSMLLLGLLLNVFRPIYLDAIPADASTDAAAAVYDELVGFIRLALRAVLVVALTLAVAMWLLAPRGSGATARRGLSRGISAVRSGRSRAGLNTGGFGIALARHRTPIRVGIIGCAALVYLLNDHPTGAYALGVVITTVVILLIAEVLAAPPESARKVPAGTSRDADDPDAAPSDTKAADATAPDAESEDADAEDKASNVPAAKDR